MNNRIKYIPAIISLAAGLIASVITIINDYDTVYIMIITLAALFAFYIIGIVVRVLCEKNFVIEPEEEAEGEEESESEEKPEEEEKNEGEQADEDSKDKPEQEQQEKE